MSLARWRVPKGPATHVLMDGGILFVPREETREFYEECIRIFNSGSKLYVVEQKTERFKFFVDFDYKSPEKLSDEDLMRFVTIIHEALGTTSRCLIARTRPRALGTLVKTGVHIHWPDLVVSRSEAMNFRTKIITSLGDGPWDSIIDAAVYGGSGLRMLWSHKKPTGDPYMPWRELGHNDMSNKTPCPNMLELFAVRTNEETNSIAAELGRCDTLQEYVRNYITGQQSTTIKKVQRTEHDGWFVQTDSKYCERIHGHHKRNHVWFFILSGQIFQRCFDEECKDFSHGPYNLSPTIVNQLSDVVVVGSPVHSFFDGIQPDGCTNSALQALRARGPSVFGAGPGQLEAIFRQSPLVRAVGFQGVNI